MSAEALWQGEIRRVWDEFKEVWTCFKKIETDMYKGEGPANPPITLRMSAAEGRLDRIEGRQGESRKILLAVLVALIADFVKDAVPPLFHAIFR